MKKFFWFMSMLFMISLLFSAEYPYQLQLTSPFGPHPEFNFISYDDLNWKSPEDQIILFNLVVNKTNPDYSGNVKIRFSMSWKDVESVEIFNNFQTPLSITNKDIIRSAYPGGLIELETGNLDNVFDALKPLVMDSGKIPDGDYTFSFVIVDENYQISDDYNEHKLSNPVYLTFTVKSPMDITLVSPGGPLSSNPVLVSVTNPYFVWVSNFEEYTIKVWEENNNMHSQEQFESVTPLFTTTVMGSSYEYPPSAPVLKHGKVYAWQIVAKLRNSLTGDSGNDNEYQKSKIYHFRVSSEHSSEVPSVQVIENYLNRYKPEGWQQFLELIRNGYTIENSDLDEILNRISTGKKIIGIEID